VGSENCGSPPRAWGQLFESRRPVCRSRFTPTCVGTTATTRTASAAVPVHPHVRGDNPTLQYGHVHDFGSPPRAWGQLHRASSPPELPRFTPTCVGTTVGPFRVRQLRPVHPHVRGDNTSCPPLVSAVGGSPPRAWGQRARTDRQDSTSPVHPHVRGDNKRQIYQVIREYGSPPRAWGQQQCPQCEITLLRFTPTCVGTTSSQPLGLTPVAVHPHVRGDNTTVLYAVDF
jgi:hypothetical protein